MEKAQPKNIFSFYEELIIGGLQPIIDEFYLLSQQIEISTKDGPKKEMVFLDGNTNYNLQEYLILISKRMSRKILHNIELILLDSNPPPNIKTLLAKYYSDLDYYISKLKNLPLTGKHLYFVQDLEIIRTDSLDKMKYLEEQSKTAHIETNQGVAEESSTSLSKIKNSVRGYKLRWLANNNVLFTLFYDLLHGQDKNPAIIEASSSKVVQEFIIDNFVDSQGQPFSRLSVETCFSKEREKKRARIEDRIDTIKVKIKKVPG